MDIKHSINYTQGCQEALYKVPDTGSASVWHKILSYLHTHCALSDIIILIILILNKEPKYRTVLLKTGHLANLITWLFNIKNW